MIPFKFFRHLRMMVVCTVLVFAAIYCISRTAAPDKDSTTSQIVMVYGRVAESDDEQPRGPSAYVVKGMDNQVAVITDMAPPCPGALIILIGKTIPLDPLQVVVAEWMRFTVPLNLPFNRRNENIEITDTRLPT